MRTYTRTAYVDGSNAFVDDVYDVYLIFEEARNSHVRFETDRINICLLYTSDAADEL